MMDENLESRVETLLAQLTLQEKCALLSGIDNWRTTPIPRLGIPSLVMTDGPHGVRATLEAGRRFEPATSFPTGVSMAATWDPQLIRQVGEALADETLALDCDILLGPCVNIVRHPLAGRNFESYSEDPYLAGRIGAAWVQGLQSKGVGASLKHYACNNQETERGRGSSEVDERTLREIYLAQFEHVVQASDPWTVMCSYNRLNGIYASQNHHLLKEILKGEWAFPGIVVSDWGANHTIYESVHGGLDLEMPGPAKYYGHLLYEAVQIWQIDEADVNDAARRMLRLVLRSGRMDAPRPAGALNTPAHQALARQTAAESITLLKNEGDLLPLNVDEVRSIALIGPMASAGAIGGGGSSFVQPPYRVSLLEALQERLAGKVRVDFAQGCDNYYELPVVDPALLRPARGRGHGLRGEYFANAEFAGKPVLDRVDERLEWWWLSFAPLDETPRPYSIRWTGRITPQASGRHTLKIHSTGICRVYLDDLLVLEALPGLDVTDWPGVQASTSMDMQRGKPVAIKIEYIRPPHLDAPHLQVRFASTPLPEADLRMEQAVALAKKADLAIVCVGWPEGHESEGWDRPNMSLTGRQDALIRAVTEANPRTVVVLNCGSPVFMPWVNQVPAILEAYYPGQEGGNALADILLGVVNPSGKLTVTFPRRLQDTPAYNNFPGFKQVSYGEGLFVGYRHYDQREIEPVFPFGHGLSYTRFDYQRLGIPETSDRSQLVRVEVTVENSGERFGQEVVQLYVAPQSPATVRPLKELKGFAKVALQPGERKTVELSLDTRAFAYYDPERRGWITQPGIYQILVGSSATDIRLRAELKLL